VFQANQRDDAKGKAGGKPPEMAQWQVLICPGLGQLPMTPDGAVKSEPPWSETFDLDNPPL
jgi:hypothetical protein